MRKSVFYEIKRDGITSLHGIHEHQHQITDGKAADEATALPN